MTEYVSTLHEYLSKEKQETQPEAEPSNHEATLLRLSALSAIDYEKERKGAAKLLGIRASTLDGIIKDKRAQAKAADSSIFPVINSHHEPIEPGLLLNEIVETVRQFIVLDENQATAAALLITASWFIDVMDIMPLTIISAPERSCGKTQLLTVFSLMVRKPLETSNAPYRHYSGRLTYGNLRF